MERAPFTPLYKEITAAVARRCGAAALGVLAVLAKNADWQKDWTVQISLRDLAAQCCTSVNTLRKTLLPALAQAGFVDIKSQERNRTEICLRVFCDVENGKSVSNFDTEEQNKQKKSVSNADTEPNLFSLFSGAGNEKSVLTADTEEAKSRTSVAEADTGRAVAKFDTEPPLHTTPQVVINNNLINKKAPTPADEKKKNTPVSLEEVKAYFAEKGYITDAEDFYYKNEARGWIWTDKAGKNHKIKNWKGCAYEFEKHTRARGKVNWAAPQKTEEKLFAWYYQSILPQAFANEDARAARWAREKGDFAFIASVARDFEQAKQIIIFGAESLEKAGFSATPRALANNAMWFFEEICSKQNKGAL